SSSIPAESRSLLACGDTSPQGEVSPQANNDLLSAGMELLKGKLFR
ncbi:hypothetical protein PSZ80_24300, partial [Shigella sonnei]|nr:hypothetical protein [Shigella sonnei]